MTEWSLLVLKLPHHNLFDMWELAEGLGTAPLTSPSYRKALFGDQQMSKALLSPGEVAATESAATFNEDMPEVRLEDEIDRHT